MPGNDLNPGIHQGGTEEQNHKLELRKVSLNKESTSLMLSRSKYPVEVKQVASFTWIFHLLVQPSPQNGVISTAGLLNGMELD